MAKPYRPAYGSNALPSSSGQMIPGAGQQGPQKTGVQSATTPYSQATTGLAAIGGTTGTQVPNPNQQVGGSVPGQQQLGAGTVGNPMGATGGNLGNTGGAALQKVGKIPGPPGSTPAQPGFDNSQNITDITKLYDDMLKQEAGAWGQQQGLLQQQSNNLMRGAALTNARMGRSMGGGFASLQGSALGQGMNEMTKAGLAYDERRRGLEKDKFGKILDEKHRGEERNWQLSDEQKRADERDQQRKDDWAWQYYEATGQMPTQEEIDAADGSASEIIEAKEDQQAGTRNKLKRGFENLYGK